MYLYSPRTGAKMGRRDACLLIFGFIQLVLGVALLLVPVTHGKTRTIPVLELVMPASGWAWVWIVLGIVVSLSAFERAGAQRLGCILAYLTPFFWATAWFTSFVLGLAPLGWLTAIVYAGYAGLALIVSGWEEPLKGPPVGTFGERDR